MWVSKLKKKKGQYFLLGVIFAIAIALISVTTIVTVVSKTFVEEYYKGDSTPDITVITSNERAVEKSHSWYEAEGSEARNYKKLEMFSVSTNLSFNNKVNDSLMSFVIPMVTYICNISFKYLGVYRFDVTSLIICSHNSK